MSLQIFLLILCSCFCGICLLCVDWRQVGSPRQPKECLLWRNQILACGEPTSNIKYERYWHCNGTGNQLLLVWRTCEDVLMQLSTQLRWSATVYNTLSAVYIFPSLVHCQQKKCLCKLPHSYNHTLPTTRLITSWIKSFPNTQVLRPPYKSYF